MKRTPLRRQSTKRRKLMHEYGKLRKQFLADHPYCQVWLLENGLTEEDIYGLGYLCSSKGRVFQDNDGNFHNVPYSIEIHHRKGRGKYLLDTSTWCAVSREMHDRIHQNPKWAYEKGYLLNRTDSSFLKDGQ